MNWNPIAWLLAGAMVPFLSALTDNNEPTPEAQFIFGLYGYLVICGVIFNCVVLVVFVAEVLL